ncbi:PEP-CTERM sorting domain-containing protein [Salinisphaera hydrothermalis]|uniref:PEP-CTERM sorting domain-containing protein n=1 Tax=Salinisphaera hydrothermalis TaxID=563188 RepID=UPI00333F4E0B
MKKIFYGTAGAIAALAFAGSAFANQIDINTAADGPYGNKEPTLYQIATNPIYGNGGGPGLFTSLGPSSTQFNNGTWQISTTGSMSQLQATYTANFGAGTTFGVYDINDPGTTLELLGPGTANGPNANRNSQRGILYYSGGGLFMATMIDGSTTSSSAANFGSDMFGFFLTIGGNTYYSDSSRNGDKARMVGFRGAGNSDPSSTYDSEYLFGWEDGTDNDYQDYVVTVNGIRPVPEPSSIAMFGVGLLMIGFAARRLQKRNV